MSERDFAEEEVVEHEQPEGEHVEEEVEEAPESEQAEEEVEEAPKPKKSKPRNYNPYKTRLNQTQKEKFQAISEAQRLQQENDYLRQQMELSNQTGMFHYEASVDQRLQRTEKMLEQAIESGDVRGQAEAQRELADAVAEKRRILESKAQQSIQQQQQQQQQQYYNQIHQDPEFVVDEYQKHEVARWAARNPYFDQKSPEYDPHLSDAVEAFADRLERTLISTGRGHMVCTRDYFNELDKYAQSFYEDRPATNNQGRQLNMRPSNQYVAAPTRGGMQSGNSGSQDNMNTPINGVPADHIRDMAKRLGIDEKKYRNMMRNDKGGMVRGGSR